jgi:predicted  nucleic acid-binding Zn-ribbon protein
MKRLMMVTGCAVAALSIGTMAVRAQDAAAGDQAALKTQLKELRMKASERQKVIDALPAVVDAKQVADAAAAKANNTEYAKLRTARSAAKDALSKILADLAAKDEQYVTTKKQLDELRAKDNEPRGKLKTATPEARPALEAEIASLKTQQEPLRQAMNERMKVLEGQPEAAAAKKTVDEASSALVAFENNDAEFAKLRSAEKDARSAYDKAKKDAQAADAEHTALQLQISELQKKIEASK